FFYVNLVSFLNLGLAGFVLASIAARFIFPAVSLEGRQMWLLRSSPLDLRALLWSKYWVGTLPLLILGMILTGLTNALLEVTPFMMILSLATMAGLTQNHHERRHLEQRVGQPREDHAEDEKRQRSHPVFGPEQRDGADVRHALSAVRDGERRAD